MIATSNNLSDNNGDVDDSKSKTSDNYFLSKRESLLFMGALIYANFTESACYSLIAPFFPKIAEEKGASPTVYGFIFGILEVVIVLTSPIFGKLVRLSINNHSFELIQLMCPQIAYISPNYFMKYGIFVAGLTMFLFG